MKRTRLITAGLIYHRRMHLAVLWGIAVGCATITGALMVGDSMGGSLRQAAIGRLGRIDHVLRSDRFFREALAGSIASDERFAASFAEVAPVIRLTGAVTHAERRSRVNRVTAWGVDDRFWTMRSTDQAWPIPVLENRSVVLNETLAQALGASVGDDVLLRLGKPAAVSTETLLGRRDDTSANLRLKVRAIIPAKDVGSLSLTPRHQQPNNLYVPLQTLQRALDQRDRVNTLLIASLPGGEDKALAQIETLQDILHDSIQAEDVGVHWRNNETLGYVSLESKAMLIDPAIEKAAMRVGQPLGLSPAPIITYLANEITLETDGITGPKKSIPYSTVSAIDPTSAVAGRLSTMQGGDASQLQDGEILLNEWAADDLDANLGDRIGLTYYLTGSLGELETVTTTFSLRGVVRLKEAAADRGFTPEYEGVTDTENLADWDAPFPVDMKKVRDKDEAYWDDHGATPKAFITLNDARRLWAEDTQRLGVYTAIRYYHDTTLHDLADATALLDHALLKALEPASVGLVFEPIRQRLSQSGKGTTDFGGLFIGFSFFLIASAAMLVVLLFRLGVERRAKEAGLLRALGYHPKTITRIWVGEGVVIAVLGSGLGLIGAWGYAKLMIYGLRNWWSDAANTPFLTLHVSTTTLVIGFGASLVLGILSIIVALRGFSKHSVREILFGVIASDSDMGELRTWRTSSMIAVVSLLTAVLFAVLPWLTESMPQAVSFFLSGASLLTGGIAAFRWMLSGRSGSALNLTSSHALSLLSMRNARRNAGRSVLTAGLIASASFLITSLQAFHLEVDTNATLRTSGTGGYTLFAESSVPLVYDLNTPAGRESLSIDPQATTLADLKVTPFRLRPGDAASCLNLYQPTKPRMLGATNSLIERGGFSFSKTSAKTDEEKTNPWKLLNRTFADGAIPVIGDEAAVLWQFHAGLGKDLVITDARGQDVRLRFVALLSGSMLQDELIVSEAAFLELFPSINGYGFFLIETPLEQTGSVSDFLEDQLTRFGFDVDSTTRRLRAYLAVQNTYLSTFQMLGGFGLILGTLGLTAVMLRNVWERRRELALMRAVGFTRQRIGWYVVVENLALLSVGLLIGVTAALLAVAPHLLQRPGSMPLLSLVTMLLAVWIVGSLAVVLATIPALRAPLIGSLRSE